MMNRSVSTINRFPPIRNIPLSRRFLRMESRQRSSLLLIIKKQSEIPPTMKSHPSEHRRSSDLQSFAAFHRVNICATVEIARGSDYRRSPRDMGANSIAGFHRNCHARIVLPSTVFSGSIILIV